VARATRRGRLTVTGVWHYGRALSSPPASHSDEQDLTMVKITVLYGQPDDAGAFEDHYANEHVPLAAKMPNVARFEATRVVATPDGSPAPYYRMAELWFESMDAMQGAMGSEEGRATVADIQNFATGGATVLIGETD
jgi:uncharacterized protein (TIGR02118 family)